MSESNDTVTPEVWKPVVGCEADYEVSNLGRVRSLPPRHRGEIVQEIPETHGKVEYRLVWIDANGRRKQRRVHRLVLETFVGPRPAGMLTRHLDGNPANNRLSNLTYGTPQQNSADMMAHGTTVRGEQSKKAKLTEADVLKIRGMFAPRLTPTKWRGKGFVAVAGKTMRQVAAEYGVGPATITRLLQGVCWGHLPTGQRSNGRP